MGRPRRAANGGIVYHVLNRANARQPIFETNPDYAAFERILAEGVERTVGSGHVYQGRPSRLRSGL